MSIYRNYLSFNTQPTSTYNHMYKPTLKRNNHSTTDNTHQNYHYNSINHQLPTNACKLDNAHLMVPLKMLETPTNKNKDKQHIITPLLVKNHNYPKTVTEKLNNNCNNDENRGIGGYREVNWFFQNRVLTLWITDKEKEAELQLQQNINCLAVGQFKTTGLPSKMKNKYIIAVGCSNEVKLFCLNSFTLQTYQAGIKYTLRHSLQVEQIKFVQNNKLLIASDTGLLQLVELGQKQSIKTIQMPFYRHFLPVSVEQTTQKIEHLVYTPKRIFALVTEISNKWWLRVKLQSIFSDYPDPQHKARYIQVYEITPRNIVKQQKITEKELTRKIKNYVPNWNKEITIKTIYADHQNDKEGQLGVVTECGCFLTVRTNSNTLSREPLFVPNRSQLGECQFVTHKKLELLQFTTEEQKNNNNKVISSLGYQNLTLLEDSLLWIGEERIDGILSSQLVGELCERQEYCVDNLLEKHKKWGLFGFKHYFTISQLPIRHFIATLLFVKSNLTNQYLGLHFKQQKFSAFLDKYIQMLSPEVFLKYLIELIVSQERFMTINTFFLDLIQSQLKEEKIKEFKDWKHELTPDLKTQQIFINENILQNIWTMVLEMQYKDVSLDLNNKHVNLYQSNALWLAMHRLYHNIVSPIYNMNQDDFRCNKHLIQDIHQMLNSVCQFFQTKQNHEISIKQACLNKNERKDYSTQDNTDSSLLNDNGVDWMPEMSKRSIATKSLNENYQILESKIKLTFKATATLMTIYYNLEDNTSKNSQGKSQQKLSNIAFKQLLSSRQLQKSIKKHLVSMLSFNDLLQLDKTLPTLNLAKDLAFLSCTNKITLQKASKQQIDLQELANSLASDYFQDMDILLQKRYDLKLKTLGLYLQSILKSKDQLVQSNTLKQRNLISRNLFPEDQEEILKFKRNNLDKQLDLTVEEQKKCISRAVHTHSEAKIVNANALSPVIDQILIYISSKAYLIQHMEQELKRASLISELHKLQKIKPKHLEGRNLTYEVAIKPQYIKRNLFPDPSRL